MPKVCGTSFLCELHQITYMPLSPKTERLPPFFKRVRACVCVCVCVCVCAWGYGAYIIKQCLPAHPSGPPLFTNGAVQDEVRLLGLIKQLELAPCSRLRPWSRRRAHSLPATLSLPPCLEITNDVGSVASPLVLCALFNLDQHKQASNQAASGQRDGGKLIPIRTTMEATCSQMYACFAKADRESSA